MANLIYLAGPITGLNYEKATEWRKYVIDKMPSHIRTLSPMRAKPEDLYKKQSDDDGTIKQTYEDHPLCSSKGINVRDFSDVRRADLIFVNFLGAKTVSIGTVMEIAWARAFNKLVVLIMEKGNVHDHAMLKYPCGFIVDNLDEGIQITKAVLSTDQELR